MQVKYKLCLVKDGRMADKFNAWRGREDMNKKKNKILFGAAMVLVSISFTSNVAAKETIIQQEKIPFEKCLKVITTSEDKLSVAPEVTDVSDQKRVAVFTLVDGTLTITCDELEGNVTVSTNTN